MNLQGFLIERIENRVLVGITLFLATMVLVGWVAINEPGRLASFQEQHLARSVEKGAELFAGNCAPCHGPSGLGSARAPALNNPQLFGAPVLADIATTLTTADNEIARLEDAIKTLGSPDPTSDMTDEEIADLAAKVAALHEEFGDNPVEAATAALTAAQAEHDAIFAPIQTAIDKGYDPAQPDRLGMVGWGGTLEGFVMTTLISGRPVSTSYWPEPMPVWSRTGGGPLRQDQIEDLTNYVLNWGANRAWTTGDLLAVNQFAKVPSESQGPVVADAVAPEVANLQLPDIEANRDMINSTIDAVMADMPPEMIGDPNNGQALYTGSLACSSCHNTAVAPTVDGTFTRVQNTRLQDPLLAGYTPEHYLIESILVPNAYVAPGFPANAMPQNFGERLTAQDLLDLVAYLESQDGPDPLAP